MSDAAISAGRAENTQSTKGYRGRWPKIMGIWAMSELPAEQRCRDYAKIAFSNVLGDAYGFVEFNYPTYQESGILNLTEVFASFERDNNLVPAPQWQPIETAPKDGTRFLALDIVSGEVGCLSISLAASINDDEPEVIYFDHGFQRVTLNPEPTHWMPFSPPPNMEASHD